MPVILLKGAHLAQVVYSNIALRPMGDIDILVKKNDLPKAKELLLELGYTPIKEVDIATACAYSQHISPMIKQNAPPVELHWTLGITGTK
ncbi:MAG: nucleotidyltransferase family protein [Planctomycetes bacterium]|nr:nucleotidyltransferase family protein [Planctomycetota bacterium]